jgi:hypothetical protein
MIYLLLFCVFFIRADERIDEILATIYHKEGVELVLRSDIRPGLDGVMRDLRRAILERLVMLDAILLRVMVTDDDVDRSLDQMQKREGVTRSAIDAMLREMGFTPEEGRTELRRKQLIDAAVDYRVRGSKELVVDQSAIADYDACHPQMTEASYTLAQSYVPCAEIERDELEIAINDPAYVAALSFDRPFTVLESEVPEDRHDALSLPVGSIVEIDEAGDYYEITRLVAVQPAERRPLSAERAREIEMILKRDRYMEILKDYENRLFAEAYITFTYDADRAVVLDQIPQPQVAQ